MLETKLMLLLFVSFCYANEIKPFVETPLGKITGYIKTTFEGRKFAAFEGIPYAKPPIGDRRFEAPEPIEPWFGTWEATHLFSCTQVGLNQPNISFGDEDCLYINVYVPRENPNSNETLDVVAHIHGGAFMYGSGHTRPDFILDRDVIFVSFNYRLGILGFLSTEDDVVPGNNGMKDQVLALKWIQQNIASFGGNPNSVTLAGFSAGSASVHLHYFSDMSRGLFHRGFSQSGVALNIFTLQKGALEKAKTLADAVGCPVLCTQQLVSCLKQKPYKHILSKVFLFFGYKSTPFVPFAPVVEKGLKPFLRENPYHLLTKGDVADVPWIASNTAHEGFITQTFDVKPNAELNDNWKSIAPLVLDFNYTLPRTEWDSASEKIKEYYFEKNKISQEGLEKFAEMFADRSFLVDAEDAVRLQAKVTNSSVYYFLFSYPGDGPTKYVSHGADGKYYYGNNEFDPRPLSENEIKMKDVLLDMLVAYAKTGIPIINGVDWKPTKNDKFTYLNISGPTKEEMNLKSVEEFSPRSFWKSLGFLENAKLFEIQDKLNLLFNLLFNKIRLINDTGIFEV